MPAKKTNKSKSSKARVASFRSLKKSPKYKSGTLAILLLILGVIGYFVIRSFAGSYIPPKPPKNVLADRFCGTWLLQQVDSATISSNLTNSIKHGLDYQDMRGFSLRTNWKTLDNNGALNPAVLDAGRNLVAGYPGQSYSIRVIAGSKSPARLFSQPDMYWYREDKDNNDGNGDQADGAQVPLPYNPNSATFAPNTGFEREYTKLVDNLIDYAVANNIKLIHMPWYGRDWAEINYHPELWNEPNFSKDKWVEGHKRLADIVYNKVKDYPDISVEFPASGWNNKGEGMAATNQVMGYLVNASVHPLWANWSGRLFIQGNGYGVYSGLKSGIEGSSPTGYQAYRGMQMFDQTNKYSNLWATLYNNLGIDPLYGTYLEVYTESFGYEATNPDDHPDNHDNLQAAITQFATTKCAATPTDNSAPEVSISSPVNNATVASSTNLTATATDDIGVTKVEFYIDNNLVSTSSTSPYSYSWDTSLVTSGTHTIYAKAYDASGKSASSTVVTVKKPAPNQPPTVSLTSPAGGDSFTEPASVNIDVNAVDSDGSVSKVEFFNGATKLGESLSSPYQFNWPNVAAGNYTLSAKATDNQGSTAQSLPVSFSVTSPPVAVIGPPTGLGLGLSWDWSKWKNNMIASWMAPASTQGVTGYKINVFAYGTLIESTSLSGLEKTSYTIKNLSIGGKYKIQVFTQGSKDTELSIPAEKSATYNCFAFCWLAQ